MTSALDAPTNAFVPLGAAGRVVLVVASLSYVAAAVVGATTSNAPGHGWIALGFAGLTLAQLAPLLAFRPQYGWFHPFVFTIALSVPFTLRSLPLLLQGLDFHVALPELTPERLNQLVAYKYGLHALGVVAFYVGWAVGRRFELPTRITFRTPTALGARALLLVVFSTAVFFAFTARQGGPFAHLAHVSQTRTNLAGMHYIVFLVEPGVAGLLVWAAYDRHLLKNPLFWGLAVTMLTVMFFIHAGRGSLVWSTALLLVVVMLRTRRIYFARIALFLLVAVYTVAVLGHVRTSAWHGELDWEGAVAQPFGTTIAEGWSGEITQRATIAGGALPILARVPEQVELLLGESYLAVLAMPIPRALWPTKPGLTDGRVGRVFYALQAGIPPEAVGEAYWNFHIPGVVVVFFLLGIFQRVLAAFYVRHADEPAVRLLYATILIYLVNASTAAVMQVLWHVVPTIGVMALVFGIWPRVAGAPSRVELARP